MNVLIEKLTLLFKFDAGTSRGVLKKKDTWFIKISLDGKSYGIGECGPLKGLSIDNPDKFEKYLFDLKIVLGKQSLPETEEACLELAHHLVEPEFPSIRFGLETALLDLFHGGRRVVFNNEFVQRKKNIPINGLIWMGSKKFMLTQIEEKLKSSYSCLKMKIGSIDFNQECEVLEFIRARYPEEKLILRVDANGAFTFEEAKEKLGILSKFKIHSIEQPIYQGQLKKMSELCKMNLLPIALDEELIGIDSVGDKRKLLSIVRPQYIILKPTLHGGIKSCKEWIDIADELNIGWWITSALESNIGLNAIAQFTAEYDVKIHQGLGTGQLYKNNIDSPLKIVNGNLIYGVNKWKIDFPPNHKMI